MTSDNPYTRPPLDTLKDKLKWFANQGSHLKHLQIDRAEADFLTDLITESETAKCESPTQS